jgi:hypothetical protein
VAHIVNNLGGFGGSGHEDLYLTPKGTWFLIVEGNMQFMYYRRSPLYDPRFESNGRIFEPLTPDQAEEWMERNDCTDALEKYFGDEIKDA